VRVLFVNSMRSLGGGEQWLLEVAAGLAARGHDIAVAARPGSALAARSREDGHGVLELPMRGDADVDSIARLARWIRRHGVDVMSVNVQRAVRVGCAAALLAGRPPVVERRGLSFPVRPTALNRLIYGRCVSHVVANCRSIADGFVATGVIDPSKVSVIVNGIDPARVPRGGGAAVRRELGIEENAPLVAVIGRLVVDKRHRVALSAFRRVLSSVPGARMLVVGAGRLEADLREEAEREFAGSSVVFAGHRDDVPAVLDAADVLLVTSDREGMPHVVLEAMVSATPVVSTRVAGVPEMIEDGVHGLLVPIGAADAAADAVVRVLSDKTLSSGLASAASERVGTEFALSTMVDRVEELFLRLAAGDRRGPSGEAR
jgi:glycosyltransferase involved in cell wall biosynthesis